MKRAERLRVNKADVKPFHLWLDGDTAPFAGDVSSLEGLSNYLYFFPSKAKTISNSTKRKNQESN